MPKKKDLPAMPFYIGDWKKDPAVQSLPREEKMIWIEMIFLMWESEERGYLTINKKPFPKSMLANALNLDNQRLTSILTQFDELGIYSKRESDGAIYSRKIINIVELSEKRKNVGLLGGNPKLVKRIRLTKGKHTCKPNAEIETETETEIKKKEKIREILIRWNLFADKHNLPQVVKLHSGRMRNLYERLDEAEFDFKKILEVAAGSDFLLGKSTTFKLTLNFIIKNNENYIQILEGEYTNGKNNSKRTLGIQRKDTGGTGRTITV